MSIAFRVASTLLAIVLTFVAFVIWMEAATNLPEATSLTLG